MARLAKYTITDIVIAMMMLIICFITLYPFWYAIIYSFSSSNASMSHPVTLIPIQFTFENYATVFENNQIFRSFLVTAGRTIGGVLYSGTIVALAAYAISKRALPGNRFIAIFLLIPMYFSGGLLPSYILIYKLGLFNHFLVYILPHGFWAFNMLIMRTFFDSLPANLVESATIDGAGDFKVFWKIIIPLSMPVTATIAMFNGVFQWNSWFDAMLYVSNESLQPLSFILQRILKETLAAQLLASQGLVGAIDMDSNQTSPESLKMATLIVSTIPIVVIYPFLQKYFVKGFMIGAVKG
ncbi:carbohydrate ABC transporter permease [Paenibacillus sp. WQ 127069]|uniref:Carbohydrate ABC transporter permease n=1 Tax=Paenibacillus baimaensis TaxID=2982185 RepID=A0ABT2UEV2_9BACL|nr:carbohydrate ABC transporter permease [Paenibacillus sp. WQ 127069]MCU6793169.1 carbohydrate ABC transporter permease [Paenibacillus sp. WQ 127069]